jgi:hypothetical protein
MARAKKSSWFDETTHEPLIAAQAQRLESFTAAMADGRIEDAELQAQEQRLVQLMQEIEPKLSGPVHAQVTQLLCELTAYDIMQTLHSMQQARPKTAFRG